MTPIVRTSSDIFLTNGQTDLENLISLGRSLDFCITFLERLVFLGLGAWGNRNAGELQINSNELAAGDLVENPW